MKIVYSLFSCKKQNHILYYTYVYSFFCFSTVLKESGYNNIYFRIKEIRILFDFCTECNQTQRIFLEEFTKMDTSAFCLAHIFTFRDFPAGIQGLAYKGQVCSRSHNTGFTTFLNHKVSYMHSVLFIIHKKVQNITFRHT